MRELNYTLTDLPIKADEHDYAAALNEAIQLLSIQKDLISLYQIGGTSAPGISDLDVIAVFKNNTQCNFNLLKELSSRAKYFFIHDAYGVSEDYFKLTRPHVFYQNCKLLYGEDIKTDNSINPSDEIVKRQIALHFLIKMFIVMTVQNKYNIIKVRAFLLEANGLKYDIGYMSSEGKLLTGFINDVIDLRKNWFTDNLSIQKLKIVFSGLYTSLEKYIESELKINPVFLPGNYNSSISSVATLEASDKFKVNHSGFILPSSVAAFAGRKYFNLQNRFNKFRFEIPSIHTENIIMISYLDMTKKMREYNEVNLPHFLPLSSSLKIA